MDVTAVKREWTPSEVWGSEELILKHCLWMSKDTELKLKNAAVQDEHSFKQGMVHYPTPVQRMANH